MNLTNNELELLTEIKSLQNEAGHSDFTNEEVKSKSVAGVLSSLVQKGLVYDSYENLDSFDNSDNIKMWCLTMKGVALVGTPECWD